MSILTCVRYDDVSIIVKKLLACTQIWFVDKMFRHTHLRLNALHDIIQQKVPIRRGGSNIRSIDGGRTRHREHGV